MNTTEIKKIVKNVLLGLAGLLVLVLFFTARAVVPANTVGVKVSAFSGVSKKTLATGWHFKVPFVEQVHLMPTSVQTQSLAELTTQTKDGQFLNTTVDVKYRVRESEAMAVFKDYTTMDRLNAEVISPAVQRAIERVTGNYDIYDILGSKRTEVYEQIDTSLEESLKTYKLDFISFTIVDQDAGDEIEQAIREESIKQKQVDSAKQEQEKVKIEGETAKLKAQAEADAKVIEAQGEAEANSKLSGSITDELIRMKEAEARLKHGWVEVQTKGEVITDTTP